MTEIGDLLHLQSLDSEAAAEDGRLADLDARLAHSAELEAAEQALRVARTAEESLGQEQRRLEASLEDLNARIAPDEKRLYDGSVKNPKELTAIGQEIEHLKERRGALEDELLQVLERGEAAAAATVEATAAFEEATARREVEVADLGSELRDLKVHRAELDEQRDVVRARIAPATLARYHRLLERKGGVAVAIVRGSACQGCRVALPDAVRRRAATSPTPVECPNCERMLSVGG